MIQTIIFDLGKVIVDFSWEKVIAKLSNERFQKLGLSLKDFTHHESLFQYERGEINDETYAKNMCDMMQNVMSTAEFKDFFNDIFIGVFPHVDSMIDAYKNNYKLVALTNINAMHYDKILELYGDTLSKFEFIYASHLMQSRKPEPAIFEKMLLDLNTLSENCIFLDDMIDNIKTAETLGFNCIHVQKPSETPFLLEELLSKLS